MLLIDTTHKRRGRWEHLIDEDEDSLLRRQLDALANDVDELTDGQIAGHEIFLLVDGCDVRFFDLLADDGDAVAVLLADSLRLCLALLEGMLVLELGAHSDGLGWDLSVDVVWS